MMRLLVKIGLLSLVLLSGVPGSGAARQAPPSLPDAAAAGDLPRVRALLSAKAKVDVRSFNGATPLMNAARNGHLDVVRALLAARADVNAVQNDQSTALIIASQSGHAEVLRALLDAGANIGAGRPTDPQR